MSKVHELKGKYVNVNTLSFNFFVDADKTPTKKYLDYMLKMWDRRAKSNVQVTKNKIVQYVKLFDEFLPYITIKDIYDNSYNNLLNLISEVEKAITKKEDKTFIKEDHIIVIHETPEYLFISPKTFRGSLKYGSNTKWCTASKLNEGHFNSYKKGYLVYLIDKTGKRKSDYSKIAFYAETNFLINGFYLIYTASDASTNINKLILGGWSKDELSEIDIYYRQFMKILSDLRMAKEEVEKVIEFMKSIDITKFNSNLEKLKIENSYSFNEVTSTIKMFNDKFSTFSVNELLKN